MNQNTWRGFVDELVKISGRETQGSESVQPVDNASLDPMNTQGKSQGWEQKTAPGKKPSKDIPKKQKPPEETPAIKANNLFGLPLAVERKGKRRYDEGSTAASSPDRSQSPVNGQSTANISAGNAIAPASGPGGV
jgi:hypothetical protein